MKLSKGSAVLLSVLLSVFHILWYGQFCPTAKNAEEAVLPESVIRIPSVSPTPAPLSLHAHYACVMDGDSHRILHSRESAVKVPMASTTKIMTALLALESKRTDEIVTASKKAASMPKVHLGMKAGYRYRMKDLLYSLMLESHNDTAVAVAEHLGGSVEQFARKMNEKAAGLGMNSTHFVTPNGLDADGHFSTARDMCLLASYAIKNPDFLKLIQTKTYRFSDISGKRTYSLNNRDAFLSYYDGALGVKTGFTGKAGYCFVGAAKQNGITLTSCVLACGWPPDKSWKWTDTKSLMDYGFRYYTPTELPVQDLTLTKIPVTDGKKDSVSLRRPEAVTTLTGSFDSLRITYQIPDSLCAPVRTDTPVGSISFYINDELFQKVSVFASENIEKSCFSDKIEKVLNTWMEILGFRQRLSSFESQT